MAKMGNVEWIMNGRISIGATEEERKLDIIHAQGFLEGREISFVEASNKLSKFDETMNQVSETMNRVSIAHDNNMEALDKLTHDLSMMENNTKKLLNSTRTVA